MSKSKLVLRITIGIVCAAVLISLVALLTPIRIHRGLSPEAWASKLGQEIPLGSSYSFVVSYLDKAGIEHSSQIPKERKVFGIIRDTCWAAMLQCSTDMEFMFDENGGLSRISVKEGLTGL